MIEEQHQRLAELLTAPWREHSKMARERIPLLSSAEAARYFRSHKNSRIRDSDEVALRRSFDHALCEFQLLELAVACGYLSIEIVRPVAEVDFDALLSSSSAREYLRLYDFLTVRYLAARLGRDLGLPEVTPPAIDSRAAIRFAAFVSLHADFMESEVVDRFTQILDDFRFAKCVNAAFLKAQLAHPEKKKLSSEARRAFEEGALGLFEFVQILSEIFSQLKDSERPLFGCFYGYWLGHFFGERREQWAYRRQGVSFEDVDVHSSLWPADDEFSTVRREHLRGCIAVMRETWEQTKDYLDKLGNRTFVAPP